MNGRRYRLCSARRRSAGHPARGRRRSAPSMLARKSSVVSSGRASRCAEGCIRSAFFSGRKSQTLPSACW